MEPPSPRFTEEETKAQRQKVAPLVAACEGCATCSLSASPCENPAMPVVHTSDEEAEAQSKQPTSPVDQPQASESFPVP